MGYWVSQGALRDASYAHICSGNGPRTSTSNLRAPPELPSLRRWPKSDTNDVCVTGGRPGAVRKALCRGNGRRLIAERGDERELIKHVPRFVVGQDEEGREKFLKKSKVIGKNNCKRRIEKRRNLSRNKVAPKNK